MSDMGEGAEEARGRGWHAPCRQWGSIRGPSPTCQSKKCLFRVTARPLPPGPRTAPSPTPPATRAPAHLVDLVDLLGGQLLEHVCGQADGLPADRRQRQGRRVVRVLHVLRDLQVCEHARDVRTWCQGVRMPAQAAERWSRGGGEGAQRSTQRHATCPRGVRPRLHACLPRDPPPSPAAPSTTPRPRLLTSLVSCMTWICSFRMSSTFSRMEVRECSAAFSVCSVPTFPVSCSIWAGGRGARGDGLSGWAGALGEWVWVAVTQGGGGGGRPSEPTSLNPGEPTTAAAPPRFCPPFPPPHTHAPPACEGRRSWPSGAHGSGAAPAGFSPAGPGGGARRRSSPCRRPRPHPASCDSWSARRCWRCRLRGLGGGGRSIRELMGGHGGSQSMCSTCW